jgi:gas vesicle protein
MKDSGFGSFLAGVVIGGLIGAAIGLLLAPRAGDETREQVGEFVGEKRAAIGEAINEGRAAAEKARAEMMSAYDASGGEPAPEGAAS